MVNLTVAIISVVFLVLGVIYVLFLWERKEVWRGDFYRLCDVLELPLFERQLVLERVRQGLRQELEASVSLKERYFARGLGYHTSGDLISLADDVLTPYFRCLELQGRGELLPGRPPEDDEEGLPLYEWDLQIAQEEFEKAISESGDAPWYRRILAQSRQNDADVRSEIA